ncbi:MAG: hypothetical protein JWM65_3546, partial [Sphingomonas bacterium]|nr:hypothetical protein [Sphingomonas bacterium]
MGSVAIAGLPTKPQPARMRAGNGGTHMKNYLTGNNGIDASVPRIDANFFSPDLYFSDASGIATSSAAERPTIFAGQTSAQAANAAPVATILAGPNRVGIELLVNTATVNSQSTEQVTALSNGGFVVTWQDNSSGVGGATGDTSSTAIKAQVYAADGSRIGSELLVNTATASAQNAEQITALSNGGFVVTWSDNSLGVGGATGDTSSTAIKAQVYAADGSRIGTELLVNTATANDQKGAQIKALANGGFVVTWTDNSAGVGGATGDTIGAAIKAQVYAADGSRIGTELLVNTATSSGQTGEQITALSNGGFVVTWTDSSAGVGGATGDASTDAVKAQVYAPDGSRIGTELLVNTATVNGQSAEQITALSNGGFVVTWIDNSLGVGGATGDTSSSAIKAQVYAADGSRIGSELLVNTATAGAQNAEQITALSNGGFVVTWTDASAGVGGATGDTSGTAIKAQVYAADGSRVGTELLVNTATNNDQNAEQITALSNGGFVVTWTDSSSGVGGATGDTFLSAIKAQVYAADGSRIGPELLVNTAIWNAQNGEQIKALANGGFVVTWTDNSAAVGGTTGDPSGTAIKAQAYSFGPGFTAVEQADASLKGRLTASDADAGSGQITATIAVGHGIVTATAGTSGATVTGSGTATVTITGTLAQVNALLSSDATSTIVYNPNTDAPPASTSLSFTVDDGGNTGTGGALASTAIQTIAITAVNDAPAGTNATLNTAEDTALTLTAAHFGFSDVDGNALAGVKITALPAGTLTDNGVAVALNQTISIADINAGKLVFTPVANANGNGAASLSFQVQDDGGTANGGIDTDQTANTLTFNVSAVNDAPVAALAPVYRVGSELLVNTATASTQNGEQITALSNGGFVVTWIDFSGGVGGATGDNSSGAIKAQVYAADGSLIGSELLVNTATANNQGTEQITALSNGGFVVTWTDLSLGVGGATGDTSVSAIKAQVYAADGSRIGSELLVNTATFSQQFAEQITALSNGGFVVTWTDNSGGVGGATGDTNSSAIKAQVYAADGSRIGTELLVNTATASTQNGEQITALSNGGFVVT